MNICAPSKLKDSEERWWKGLFAEGRYLGPVIVIVGPTGSGKTGAGIELALKLEGWGGGEVISADSRAIYKKMNIGTAKPNETERKGVVHHGIDLVEPGERFTVADWKQYTKLKIAEIRERGRVPIVVGGTGLYIDALIFDYQFTKNAQKNCSDRKEMSTEFMVFGIKWENQELRERLTERMNKLFIQELYKETEFLVKQYGWGSQAMKSNIYQFVWQYLNGENSLPEAKRLSFLDDWHLAKRQMTWFKRNEKIIWCEQKKIINKIIEEMQKSVR